MKMKKITSITEKDEIVLNLLTRKIAHNTTIVSYKTNELFASVKRASECGISNMRGMCRSDREGVAEIINKWLQISPDTKIIREWKEIYDYGVEQTGYDMKPLEKWAKENNEELIENEN